MRRFFIILFALLILAGITGCSQNDDVLHLGLNAAIVEIDCENQLLYVSDTEHEDVFGERAAIAYTGPVVQAFRKPWCIDFGFMVHTFR